MERFKDYPMRMVVCCCLHFTCKYENQTPYRKYDIKCDTVQYRIYYSLYHSYTSSVWYKIQDLFREPPLVQSALHESDRVRLWRATSLQMNGDEWNDKSLWVLWDNAFWKDDCANWYWHGSTGGLPGTQACGGSHPLFFSSWYIPLTARSISVKRI